jgi:hypothetical protein
MSPGGPSICVPFKPHLAGSRDVTYEKYGYDLGRTFLAMEHS